MPIGSGNAQPQQIMLPPIALEPARECTSPEVRDGLAYWRLKAAGREMPLHADIRPEEIPRLLPYVTLFDLRQNNGSLELFPRIAGAKFEEVFGAIHNKPLETVLPPEIVERWQGAARTLFEAREPLRAVGEVLHDQKTFIRFELVIAPLSRTGEKLDMMLLVCSFSMKGDVHPLA
ncbi:PAS domain-containing protein [Parvibaculum sp.]|uniref:PAS domain-containing protein n=1 Tax=Parvibaculum sp. TaxID=2024848 RepID=UPI001B12692F|nr:PAS domain-containing protein [Parvibaculum sp.]MBO6633246.1 PAS domain-containing protein [Parvibaculum sp.]MBO6678030.1 PAS domain-containing protein [Parvibaculum sp.]MBO6683363.1 PAS domain-containing protein [Parvibaculum sp.]MBO6904035.1 PAS domain-containing protein [Parvibaculum sp.]